MNFEGPNAVNKKEEDPQKQAEKIFGKSLKCFKKIGQVGLAAGALFVAGEAAKTVKNEFEYHKYLNSSLSTEQLQQKETNEKEIKNIFGYSAVSRINLGDYEGFLKNKEKRKEPQKNGFSGTNFEDSQKYFFTEEYSVHPKGWINGKVDQIVLVESFKKDKVGNIAGEFKKDYLSGSNIFIYGYNENFKDKPTSFRRMAEHELGHANDWLMNMDLSILERQELLLGVYRRMVSPDCFSNEQDILYKDGTKEGLLTATSEYWAEICAEYFTNPESFLKDHPNDFKLVDSIVKKKDPAFDIFNKNRGAFDPHTGQIRDIYKGK